MKLRTITLPVTDPEAWAAWTARVFSAPPSEEADASVQLGWSVLTFVPSDTADGEDAARGHHLAFAVPVGTVDEAADRIEEVTGTPLLTDDGARVIDRGGNWESRSTYFAGPENSVLEFIEHAGRTEPEPGVGPFRILGVAEVGLGVPDVAAAGDGLASRVNGRLPHGFGDPDRRVIAAYGDIDGAVVLALDDRPWYPTDDVLPVTTAPGIVL